MKKVLLAVAIVGLICTRSSAVLIVNDNFDGYANQAAFEAVWTPIGTVAPLSGALTTAQASSAPNSISTPGTATSNQSRNQLIFSSTTALGVGDQLIWSYDFRETATTGNPQRNYANLQVGTGPAASPAGQLVSMGVNNNQLAVDSGGNYFMARVLGYSHAATDPEGGAAEAATGTAAGAYFKLNDNATAGLRGTTPAWHNLKLVITATSATSVNHSYYVDNNLAETLTNVGPPLQYSVIRLGSGLSNGSVGAFFDNMRLEHIAAIPEAGSFVAMGLVGLLSAGAACVRKRRTGKAAA